MWNEKVFQKSGLKFFIFFDMYTYVATFILNKRVKKINWPQLAAESTTCINLYSQYLETRAWRREKLMNMLQ